MPYNVVWQHIDVRHRWKSALVATDRNNRGMEAFVFFTSCHYFKSEGIPVISPWSQGGTGADLGLSPSAVP